MYIKIMGAQSLTCDSEILYRWGNWIFFCKFAGLVSKVDLNLPGGSLQSFFTLLHLSIQKSYCLDYRILLLTPMGALHYSQYIHWVPVSDIQVILISETLDSKGFR